MKLHKIYLIILLIEVLLPVQTRAETSDINAFASIVFADANATFVRPANLAALLLAGGGSITLHNTDADKNINDNLHRRAFDNSTDKIFDYAGNPLTHLGATGVWYLFSENDDIGRERATMMLSALAITDTAAYGLKLIVNNDRPNGNNFSFPSAHTASSFCVASVLDEYYGPQVGIPAYLGAAMVGWRMMDAGDHWASDVLFGAILGYVVGHSVAANHKPLQFAGFRVEPMIGAIPNPVTCPPRPTRIGRVEAGIAFVKRF
jgi:membrane-associated phospholipid phosphatase